MVDILFSYCSHLSFAHLSLGLFSLVTYHTCTLAVVCVFFIFKPVFHVTFSPLHQTLRVLVFLFYLLSDYVFFMSAYNKWKYQYIFRVQSLVFERDAAQIWKLFSPPLFPFALLSCCLCLLFFLSCSCLCCTVLGGIVETASFLFRFVL